MQLKILTLIFITFKSLQLQFGAMANKSEPRFRIVWLLLGMIGSFFLGVNVQVYRNKPTHFEISIIFPIRNCFQKLN